LKKKLLKDFKFWPIVEDATGLKLFLILSLATLGQNSMEYKTKSTKNSQFIVKITRIFHYGLISQKLPYRIFSNIHTILESPYCAQQHSTNGLPEPLSLENSP
jgi:hypothetical protein